jgi:hypothetical protein
MTAYTGTIIVNPLNGGLGDDHNALGVYTIGTAVVTADTFSFPVLLGVGEKEIIDFEIWGVEFDTNAAPTATIIVGTESDPNGLLESIVAGGAGAQLFYKGNGDLIGTVTSDQNVIITLGGTVATAQTAGKVFVKVVTRGV